MNTYEADVNGALPSKVTQRRGEMGAGGGGGSQAGEKKIKIRNKTRKKLNKKENGKNTKTLRL